MPNSKFEDNHPYRLSLEELRKLPSYNSVNDEEGEAIIDDALALARMILEIID
ncbi:hypothetical protein [Salinimicrobium sp. GXAS 041]|uniref:hypothetical protein n=1 Tax=Salinimicrobium sp. GXAS 041 TaxID=3400806 RepID=UPI003C76EB0C